MPNTGDIIIPIQQKVKGYNFGVAAGDCLRCIALIETLNLILHSAEIVANKTTLGVGGGCTSMCDSNSQVVTVFDCKNVTSAEKF